MINGNVEEKNSELASTPRTMMPRVI